MTAPEKKLRYFVRREKTIQAFEEFMQSPAQLWVADMNADHGLGKTTVLLHLYRSRSQVKRAWISLKEDKFQASARPDLSQPPKLSEMAFAQAGYRTLLMDIGLDLFGEQAEAYCSLVKEMRAIMPSQSEPANKFTSQIRQFVKSSTLKIALKPEIPIVPGVLKAGLGEVEFGFLGGNRETLAELNQQRSAMTTLLAKYVARLALDGPVLIVLDDVCHIQGTFLEKWILTELLPNLSGCKVVLSHTVPTSFSLKSTWSLPIEQFSPAETRQYVFKRLGNQALELGIHDALQGRFDGNPQQIEWAVDGIELMGLSQASELPWLKQAAAWNPASRIVALAEIQLAFLIRSNPELERPIDVACILQNFDKAVFEHVWLDLGFAGEEKLDFNRFRQALSRLSFIETGKQGLWHIYPEVAWGREKNLLEQEPAFVAQVHRSAAMFYGLQMQHEEEESDDGVWERLHRYEMTNWQERLQTWLRHLAATPEAGLEIATRYFDAYFWWGEYIDFPFCDSLINYLQGSTLAERSRKVVELLARFHGTFIPMRRRTADPSWTMDVLVILGQLQDRLALHHPGAEDAARWHLRGLLDNYVAEAWSARDWRHPNALKAYQASAEAFFQAKKLYRQRLNALPANAERKLAKRLKDPIDLEDWYGSWMCTWMAGLYARLGCAEEALKTAAFAEKTILRVDPTDIEALGRIHAARGEVHFAQQQWEKARQEYQIYALYALGFLIDEYGIGGDIYTLEFLREMIELVAARTEELEARAPEALSDWWRSWRSFWQPEAETLLPASLPEHVPGPISSLVEKDELGRVLAHELPLPRLPVYESLDDYGLNLSPEYQKAVERSFYTLRERCYQQGILLRPS